MQYDNIDYLDYTASSPAASAYSILMYRQSTAVVASIDPVLAVGNPLVCCGGGGMHRCHSKQVDFLPFNRNTGTDACMRPFFDELH